MFIAASFVISPNWTKVSGKWNGEASLDIIIQWSENAIKRDELLMFTIPCINLKNSVQSKRAQAQKYIL